MGKRGKDSFLVTLWIEADGTESAPLIPWRGSVEHLATKRRLYFSNPNELIGFLTHHIIKVHESPSASEESAAGNASGTPPS